MSDTKRYGGHGCGACTVWLTRWIVRVTVSESVVCTRLGGPVFSGPVVWFRTHMRIHTRKCGYTSFPLRSTVLCALFVLFVKSEGERGQGRGVYLFRNRIHLSFDPLVLLTPVEDSSVDVRTEETLVFTDTP